MVKLFSSEKPRHIPTSDELQEKKAQLETQIEKSRKYLQEYSQHYQHLLALLKNTEHRLKQQGVSQEEYQTLIENKTKLEAHIDPEKFRQKHAETEKNIEKLEGFLRLVSREIKKLKNTE